MEEYKCNLCNTKYKTEKSLSIHNKKFHLNNQVKKYICKYCNKEYETRQSKSIHELKHCKQKEIILNKEKEEKELSNYKKEMIKAKLDLMKNKQILMEAKTINIKNNTLNQNNMINQNNNQFNILNMCDEVPNMTDKDKLEVLKSIRDDETYPIVEMVKKIYKDDRFICARNVAITNLRSHHALACNYNFLDRSNKFETVDKHNIISELIAGKKVDITNYLKHYSDTNKLTKVDKDKLKEYIYKLNDPDNRYYSKQYKDHHDKIDVIIYNSRKAMRLLLNAIPNDDSDSEEEVT